MKDQFKNYDRWKLMSPEDVEDVKNKKREKEEYFLEKYDHDRDRKKDERNYD